MSRALRSDDANGLDLRLAGTGQESASGQYDDVLATNRYTLKGIFGRGTWGTVYKAEDTATGEEVALKVLTPTDLAQEQMVQRDLTPFAAMRKEGDLAPMAYVVPRAFEVDERGTPFIRMPPYPRTLNELLNDVDEHDQLKPRGERQYLGHGLSSDRIMGIARDIASGQGELHAYRGEVHGDLKPDNVVWNPRGERYMINDLGTSTCASLDWLQNHDGPRNNLGFFYTRAPESFEGDPTKTSDVWSQGALLYRMITGEYPAEGLEDLFVSGDRHEEIDKAIKEKIRKHVPRKGRLRNLLEGSLSTHSYLRPRDGFAMRDEIDRTIQSFSTWNEIGRAVKRHGGWAAGLGGLAAVILGIALTGGISVSKTPQPQPQIDGLLYLEGSSENATLSFESENLRDLPQRLAEGGMIGAPERYSKMVTDDRNVAYLVHTHRKTMSVVGMATAGRMSAHQAERLSHYLEYGDDPDHVKRQRMDFDVFTAPAITIREAIDYLKTNDGTVDLEDVLVLSRLGPQVFYNAKRWAESDDFRHYVRAKDYTNRFVIPDGEQRFLKTWLAYIHKG